MALFKFEKIFGKKEKVEEGKESQLDKKELEKMEKFKNEKIFKYGRAYLGSKIDRMPTEEEVNEILEKARAENYKGHIKIVIAPDGKKTLGYMPAKEWKEKQDKLIGYNVGL